MDSSPSAIPEDLPEESPSCPSNMRDSGDIPSVELSPVPALTAISTAVDELRKLQLDSSKVPHDSMTSTVSEVDYGSIRRWLSDCEQSSAHPNCKPFPIQWESLPGAQLKLIDIKQRCIVIAPKDPSFVVLTYVWRKANQIRLNKATEPVLMKEGGLAVAWSKLPTTIRDAITVCERLGEQYLWVDALCLKQDSGVDMTLGILRMRHLYSAAKFTLAAVSATTADIGLLGNMSVEGERLTELLDTLLDSSPWNERAWCYQERILSHRLILFTSNGVYMQCLEGTSNAQGTKFPDEHERAVKFNTLGAAFSIRPGEDLESYISAVEYYSERNLTLQEDKINAFQGVLQRYGGHLDGQRSSFYYGLPISGFDQAFCWRLHGHEPRRRNSSFPSWSWVGWDNAVTFDRELFRKGRTNQMIYKAPENNPDLESEAIRKLAAHWGNKFGFPATGMGVFYNNPQRHMDASVTDLRIGSEPDQISGSDGLYPVFSTRCSQMRPPTPPKMISVWDFFHNPGSIPKPKWMSSETMAAPSIPVSKQTHREYDFTIHDEHDDCEAQSPLGYIWLEADWRKQRPKDYFMTFMALGGETDTNKNGEEQLITMLMCLQRMEKNGHPPRSGATSGDGLPD